MSGGSDTLVAYASVGSGHRTAAEALCAALERHNVSCTLADALEGARLQLISSATGEAVLGPLGRFYDHIWRAERVGAALTPMLAALSAPVYRPFVRRLRSNDLAAVVCTHALPAAFAARERRAGRLRAPVIVTLTDFGPHAFWPRSGIDHYFVATEESAAILRRRGLPAERITVSGVPLRTQFSNPPERDAARHALEIPEDASVALIVSGAAQAAGYGRLAVEATAMLDVLAASRDEVRAPLVPIIVSGKNEALRERLSTHAEERGLHAIVLGYVENMAVAMAAADVAVLKPGGSLTAECAASGLPMVLVGPAWGQERANLEALVGAGVAISADGPLAAAQAARDLLAEDTRLAPMRSSARALERTDAADRVAESVAALIR